MITQKLLHKELKYIMADEKFYQEADDKEKDPKAESSMLKKLHIPGPDGTKPATNKDEEDYLKTTGETIDTAGKVLKAGPVRFIKGANARANKGSIIGMASKNTFEFPVFVSKSVPLDYATATNSLLEQVYASYLQMAITLNPLIDKRTAEAGGVHETGDPEERRQHDHGPAPMRVRSAGQQAFRKMTGRCGT